MELQDGQGQTHKHALKEQRLQLDPTKEQGNTCKVSLHTHLKCCDCRKGHFLFCQSDLLIPCEAVSLANYRFTVAKEIALNTTPGQVRKKQIEMFNALLLSY